MALLSKEKLQERLRQSRERHEKRKKQKKNEEMLSKEKSCLS